MSLRTGQPGDSETLFRKGRVSMCWVWQFATWEANSNTWESTAEDSEFEASLGSTGGYSAYAACHGQGPKFYP